MVAVTFVAVGLAPAAAPPLGRQADAQSVDNVWMTERRVANLAHAGGIFEAPQNTLFAFKTAEDRGADVLEMDVHITADDQVVVIHDSTVDRTTDGAGCVVGQTLEEIKALDAAHTHVDGQNPQAGRPPGDYPYRGIATGEVAPPEGFEANDFTVPTLAEVFQARPDALMNIELKPTEVYQDRDCPAALEAIPDDERPDLVGEVARLIDQYDMADQVLVASFVDEFMQKFSTLAPHVDTSFPLDEAVALYVAFLGGNEPPNPYDRKAVQVPLRFGGIELSEDLVRYAQSHGIAVHFWTINDEAEMEMLLDWGVDGIITDRVQVLDRVLTDRGEPRPSIPGPDPGPDPDPGPGPGPGGGSDPGPDPDDGPDPDPGPGNGPDPEPDDGADPGSGPEPDEAPEPDTDTGSGLPGPEPDDGSDPGSEPAPGGAGAGPDATTDPEAGADAHPGDGLAPGAAPTDGATAGSTPGPDPAPSDGTVPDTGAASGPAATDGGPAPETGPTDGTGADPPATGELPPTGDATVLAVLLGLALLGTGTVLVAMRTLRRPGPQAG